MGISGLIAGGMTQAVDDVTERRLRELARRIEESQRAEQLQIQRDTLAAADRDRTTDNNRQQQLLDLAQLKRTDDLNREATDRNVGLDASNVLSMPGMDDAAKARELTSSVLRNPNASSAPGMLKTIEGLTKVPPKVGTHVVDGNLVDDSGNVLFTAPKTPTKPEKVGTHVIGNQLVDDSGKVIFTGQGKTPDGEASPYAKERATRTIQSVDELMGKVGAKTAGYGSLLSALPATDARNFKAELDTLKANIAFNELTAMREASKTGGALGAVSDREAQLLQSALGALDAGQSPANLKQQLQKVKESVQRWQAASGGEMPASPVSSHGDTDVDALIAKYRKKP